MPVDPSSANEYSARRTISEAFSQQFTMDPLFAPHAEICFQSIETLGEGGMGRVQRVKDRRMERFAALKTLLNPKDTGQILRFQREMKLMARLEHPSIPTVYEGGVTAGVFTTC